jgi:hypothetical protein
MSAFGLGMVRLLLCRSFPARIVPGPAAVRKSKCRARAGRAAGMAANAAHGGAKAAPEPAHAGAGNGNGHR